MMCDDVLKCCVKDLDVLDVLMLMLCIVFFSVVVIVKMR